VSFYAIWYLWAALFGFSFFRRGEAALHVVAIAGAYGWVLLVRSEPVAAGRWLTTVASLLLAGVFIDALVRRIRSQAATAAENAANLAAVVEATQRIYQHPSAEATRGDLCRTASAVAGADAAALWEPTPDGLRLQVSATAGPRPVVLDVALDGPIATLSDVARAYRTGSSAGALSPGAAGREVRASAGEEGTALWQPVIRGDAAVAVLALHWSATDVNIDENARASLVLLTSQAAVAIERAELLTRLERSALTDELTGLPNRRAWRETLPREMARAAREQWPLCVALLDIDGLKWTNDNYGHHAGDHLLKQNAASWSGVLRKVDMIARYGGDEFAVLLHDCHRADAEGLIGRLAAATPDGGFSAGIAEWDGLQDVHELMAAADERLYDEKRRRGPVGRPARALAGSAAVRPGAWPSAAPAQRP
jgi:diguanylate cyclase (GGDEF)-like protein